MHTMTAKHTKHSHHAWEMQNSQARVQPTEDLLKTKCDVSQAPGHVPLFPGNYLAKSGHTKL